MDLFWVRTLVEFQVQFLIFLVHCPQEMMFKKMWAVAEWLGEHRLVVMASAAEKLKLGICC